MLGLESKIARSYAKALVDVLPNEKLETINDQLKLILNLVDDRAIRYFKNPIVLPEKKKSLLEEILAKLKPAKELQRVLILMAQRDRLSLIRSFGTEFDKLVDERLGRVKAEIVSSTKLDNETLESIRKKLEKVLGKEVIIELKVDPNIIGGFVVNVGDKVLDASIRTQLSNLSKTIAG